MTSQPDLFADRQAEDFAPERMAALARPRLAAMLAAARRGPEETCFGLNREAMRTVFHQMANWLPDEERAAMRAAFAAARPEPAAA